MRVRSAAILLFAVGGSLQAQGVGRWQMRPPLPTARQEVGAAVLGGELYIVGGIVSGRLATDLVSRFDPVTRTWASVSAMPTPRHHFGIAAAAGKIFVLGGYVGDFCGSECPPDDRCYSYDPATQQWSPVASMPAPRGAFAAVEIGGKIYAPGGVVGEGQLTGELAVYDPATDQWQIKAPMPTPREHFGAAAVNGLLYVAGGRTDGHGEVYDIVERYDPATDQWTTLPPMFTARGGNGAASFDGKLVVLGGESEAAPLPSKVHAEVEEYDPQSNSWRSLAPMIVPVHGFYPVAVGDEILSAGGGPTEGFAVTNAVTAYRRGPNCLRRDGVSFLGFGSAGWSGHPVRFDACTEPGAAAGSGDEAVLRGAAPHTPALLLGALPPVDPVEYPWGTLVAPPSWGVPYVTDGMGEIRFQLPEELFPGAVLAQWVVWDRRTDVGFAVSNALKIEW